MGLICTSFPFMAGTLFGVFISQKYNVPSIKALANTAILAAKHFEETHRKHKKREDHDN
ncbi:hypothetical protein PTKIN_Ptkin04bG0207300 [Pterospermum kingtungense]